MFCVWMLVKGDVGVERPWNEFAAPAVLNVSVWWQAAWCFLQHSEEGGRVGAAHLFEETISASQQN